MTQAISVPRSRDGRCRILGNSCCYAVTTIFSADSLDRVKSLRLYVYFYVSPKRMPYGLNASSALHSSAYHLHDLSFRTNDWSLPPDQMWRPQRCTRLVIFWGKVIVILLRKGEALQELIDFCCRYMQFTYVYFILKCSNLSCLVPPVTTRKGFIMFHHHVPHLAWIKRVF